MSAGIAKTSRIDAEKSRQHMVNQDGIEGLMARAQRLSSSGREAEASTLLDQLVGCAAELRLREGMGPARRLLEHVLESFPDHLAAAHDLGCLFAETGEDAAAEPLLRRAWEGMPRQAHVTRNLAQVLMRRGDLSAAQELARLQLRRRPGDSFALALSAVVAVERGDNEAARQLLDFKRLVRTFSAAVPAGYRSVEEFNRALCEAVLSRTDLMRNRADRTTTGGRQSGALFPAKRGPLAALQMLIGEAVNKYTIALPPDADHPFLAQRPAKAKLHGWATVVDSGGYQQPHIHPSGWLSGVYYPWTPGASQSASQSRSGWLLFGEPSSGFHCKHEHPTFALSPEEGLMVLFPSYLHHRTEPYRGSSARISLAFDLIPSP